MRSRTAHLVYLKFYTQFGCFSWATRDWSRGWISRPRDGVKTCRPRHQKRSCLQDNHSKICQLSVLSTWLIAWVLLAQRVSILQLSRGIFVEQLCNLFNPGIQRCPSDSSISVHEVENLDLDGNASWMFWIPISFKIYVGYPGVCFLGEACLWIFSYDWSSTICCCSADYGIYLCPLHAYSMHRQPPLKTLASFTYCSTTRIRISNTHFCRFWRWWSQHRCSTGSFAWAHGIVSALFKSCCWREYIGFWSDGFR